MKNKKASSRVAARQEANRLGGRHAYHTTALERCASYGASFWIALLGAGSLVTYAVIRLATSLMYLWIFGHFPGEVI